MNLTQEEKETIVDLIDSVYWPVIEKVLYMGVEAQQEKVLTEDISNGGRGLMIARARADGAQALASYVGSLKRKQEKRKNG